MYIKLKFENTCFTISPLELEYNLIFKTIMFMSMDDTHCYNILNQYLHRFKFELVIEIYKIDFNYITYSEVY